MAALLVGCATDAALGRALQDGTQPPSVARAYPRWWREAPPAARDGIYVVQTNGAGESTLFGFKAKNRRNRPPQCTIGGLSNVEDIGSDKAGNVYVPDVGAGVSVFMPNCGGTVSNFGDAYGGPIAVQPFGSTIYVVNGNNVAVCFLDGCTSELTDPSIFQVTGGAVDAQGNVWVAYYNSSKGAPSLLVWPNGAMPGRVMSGFVNSPVPGSLLFDRSGTLISVLTSFSQINTYQCSVKNASCSLARTITPVGRSNFASLNRKQTNVAVSDLSNGSVDIYAYPSFTYEYSFTTGLSGYTNTLGITQTR